MAKEEYVKTQELSQFAGVLVPNPNIRGTGDLYALQSDWKNSSIPTDPDQFSGSGINLTQLPNPITGKYIRIPSGTALAPGLCFQATTDTDSGLYLSAANVPAMSVNGSAIQLWGTSGPTLYGTTTLAPSGAASSTAITPTTESSSSVLTITPSGASGKVRLAGTAPALEMPNATAIYWRDPTDSSYVSMLRYNASGNLLLGESADEVHLYGQGNHAWSVTPDLVPEVADLWIGTTGQRVGEIHSYVIYGYTKAETPLVKSTGTELGLATSSAANGQTVNVKVATTTVTTSSGASQTASNLVPAGSFILGVLVRVTTAITGATSFDVGDGTDVDRWGAAIAIAANTTTTLASFTANGYGQFTAANNVVLTANGSNFTGGVVRVTVYYFDMTAPTS